MFGEKSINIGNISSLPASIKKDKSSFDGAEYTAKDDISDEFHTSPTVAKEGPTFPIQVNEPERFAKKSGISILSNNVDNSTITMYTKKNVLVVSIVSLETDSPSNLTFSI